MGNSTYIYIYIYIYIGHLAQRSTLWNFQLTCDPCVNYELTRNELKMN